MRKDYLGNIEGQKEVEHKKKHASLEAQVCREMFVTDYTGNAEVKMDRMMVDIQF